jgi:hypothetical protein
MTSVSYFSTRATIVSPEDDAMPKDNIIIFILASNEKRNQPPFSEMGM